MNLLRCSTASEPRPSNVSPPDLFRAKIGVDEGPTSVDQTNLTTRLNVHARAHWPELDSVEVRFRASFAYVDGRVEDGTTIKLCWLRYGDRWHRRRGTRLRLHRLPRRVHHTTGIQPTD